MMCRSHVLCCSHVRSSLALLPAHSHVIVHPSFPRYALSCGCALCLLLRSHVCSSNGVCLEPSRYFTMVVPVSLALLASLLVHAPASVLAEREAAYDPLQCNQDNDGHCNDEKGGAWKYKRKDGSCRHEERNVPRAKDMVDALPKLFPGVHSVIDFGGGPGSYLTGFRDAGVRDIVTVEPHPLGKCLFTGVEQLAVNIFKEPVNKTYDLVMSVEVAEHIPTELHSQLIKWLISHTNRWLVFTAAHPGQPGEGHASNKEPWAWRNDFVSNGVLFNAEMTQQVKKSTSSSLIHKNLHVFEKRRRHGQS